MRFLPTRWGFVVLAVASALSAGLAAPLSPAPAVARAIRQFREFYLDQADAFAMRDTSNPAPDPAHALGFAQALRADGAWADLDYASSARSGWAPATHYTRMAAMVALAGEEGVPAAERAALLVATHRAFAFWVAHDFQCLNGWYNEIYTPKFLGTCALLLGDQLTPAEYDYVTRISLARFQIARTGQNKVWLAGNTLMLGLLTNDEAVIREAATAIWSEVRVSGDEGIQADFSFQQHGAQQQFGNYGMAFAVEAARWGRILRETPWQLPGDKLEVFRNYLLEGQNWVSWRGAMDVSACGRQFTPASPLDKTANIARVMTQAAVFDPSRRAAYEAFVARNQPGAANDLTGNKYFWRSDYMIHRRPGFAATLKMSSKRVIGAELVNSENLSGYHAADGCLFFYRTGREYEDIFPVWDWCRLPGVTCAEDGPPAFATSFVDRDFVGGVSDGIDGCCALDYVRNGVQAKKAWFFDGDTVICLGADIAGQTPTAIGTTLNQCLLHGPVRVQSAGRRETLGTGSHTLADVEFVEHDGWRYTLLDGGTLQLDTGPVAGNWHRVFDNPESPAADVTKDLFKLWLDHGREPQGAHYAYAVAPVDSSAGFHVLANSRTTQAVQLSNGKVGILFWAPGEIDLPDHRHVSVDEPCLLLAATNEILVVDPTQKLAHLRLTVDGRARVVACPTGALAGTAQAMR